MESYLASPIPLARGGDSMTPHEVAIDASLAFTPAHAPRGSPFVPSPDGPGVRSLPHEQEWGKDGKAEPSPAGQVFWPAPRNKASPMQHGIPAPPAAHTCSSGGGEGPDFMEAHSFAGSVPGYVYKMGTQGLGYYVDQPARCAEGRGALPAASPQACGYSPRCGHDIVEQGNIPGQGMSPGQHAVVLLKNMMRNLPTGAPGDALGHSRSILQVIREMQIKSADSRIQPLTMVVDGELKRLLTGAIDWALDQAELPPAVLEDLVFACLVMVNMGSVAPGAGGESHSSDVTFVTTLVQVMKAGPVKSKMHAAVVLSQIVLEGATAVEAVINSPDFLHHCTMLVCSSSDEAKSEAALLVNNLAALAHVDLQCRLAGHSALIGALKSIVQYGGPVQQCRSAGAFMHLSKANSSRGFLKSCRADEALEKTIHARMQDTDPTPDQRATLGLATMAFINLSSGNSNLLPRFLNPGNSEALVQLLVELVLSSVQQRALFGINWRLRDVLWSMRVLAGNASYVQILRKAGLVEIIGVINESIHVSTQDAHSNELVKGLVNDIQGCFVANLSSKTQEEGPLTIASGFAQNPRNSERDRSPLQKHSSREQSPSHHYSSTDGMALLLNPLHSPECEGVGTDPGSTQISSGLPMGVRPISTHPTPNVTRGGPVAASLPDSKALLSSPRSHGEQEYDSRGGYNSVSMSESVQPAYGYRARDGASVDVVRERLFQRCVRKIQGLRTLEAFNSWVANMRSDRTFLDSKLYKKLVGQLAKERVRNLDLERSISEMKKSDEHQSNPPSDGKDTYVMENNARFVHLEKELAAKQERIDMLENIHKTSVEQLVRERVGEHLGMLAEMRSGSNEDVTLATLHPRLTGAYIQPGQESMQNALQEKVQQLDAASLHIQALESRIAALPSERAHSLSPQKCAGGTGGAECEAVTMQIATMEVNASVAQLVEVLHSDLKGRAASHQAIMVAIARSVEERCHANASLAASPPPHLASAEPSIQASKSQFIRGKLEPDSSLEKSEGQDCRSPLPPAAPMQELHKSAIPDNAASIASDHSSSSSHSSAEGNQASRQASPEIPTAVPLCDLERRHSAILALSATLR